MFGSGHSFLLIVLICFAGLTFLCKGQTIYPCSIPNDCTSTEPGYSFCREGQCRQCDPTLNRKDCQCPVNQYCVTKANNNVKQILFFIVIKPLLNMFIIFRQIGDTVLMYLQIIS